MKKNNYNASLVEAHILEIEPITFQKDNKDIRWRNTMEAKLDAIKNKNRNYTWNLIDLSSRHESILTK